MLRRRVNVSRPVTESGGLVWSTPKTWERRSVPFPAVLCDELAALMVGKSRGDLVFTDQHGGVYGTPTGERGSSGLRWRDVRQQMKRSRPSRRTTSVTQRPALRSVLTPM